MPWFRRCARELSHAFLLLSCASGVVFFFMVIELQKCTDMYSQSWHSCSNNAKGPQGVFIRGSRNLLTGAASLLRDIPAGMRMNTRAVDDAGGKATNLLLKTIITSRKDDVHTQSRRGKDGLPASSNKVPLILFWTPLFGKVSNWNTYVAPLFAPDSCPAHQCHLTSDQSQLSQADLILFSAYTADQVPFSKPWTRTSSQIWAFFSMESPANIFFRSEASYRHWDGLFNWTITYRLDSDVPAVYGKIFKRSGITEAGQKKQVGFDDNNKEDGKESVRLDALANFPEAARVINSLKGRKMAVALISNCHTSSKRETFIQRLQAAGLDIDVYGRCGTLATGSNVDYVYLSARYKFFLAFENSVCRDYATEKVFAALQFPWIPVVLGGADYGNVVPPLSVIQANGTDEFSAQALVKLLKDVANDEERYLSFFRWRDEFVVEVPYNWGCDLCKMLKDRAVSGKYRSDSSKVYMDLHGWWVEESKCQNSPTGVSDLGNLAKDFLHNIF